MQLSPITKSLKAERARRELSNASFISKSALQINK